MLVRAQLRHHRDQEQFRRHIAWKASPQKPRPVRKMLNSIQRTNSSILSCLAYRIDVSCWWPCYRVFWNGKSTRYFAIHGRNKICCWKLVWRSIGWSDWKKWWKRRRCQVFYQQIKFSMISSLEGTFNFRYFDCPPQYGIFVPVAKVSLSPSARKSRLSRSGSKESLTSVGTLGSIASTATSRLRMSAQVPLTASY